ncbi:MAG: vWA domain-containing protein [Leadbetterella sp.]
MVLQSSVIWIFVCILCGFVYAVMLYSRSTISKPFSYILAAFRGILVSILAFLLLNPLFKYVQKIIETPKVVLLFDNSQSMKFGGENVLESLKKDVFKVAEALNSSGYEAVVQVLDSDKQILEPKEITHNLDKTNISNALQNVKNSFEGKNLTDIVVISDGIINDGFSPSALRLPARLHGVGFGDTVSKKDIQISGIIANKIAYFGNKFVVSVDISSIGYPGNPDFVQIKNSQGKVISRKDFNISSSDFFTTLNFELVADKLGKARFIAEVGVKEGEFSKINNVRELVVDVVNGKEKVLLLASSPHPDIKCIRSILDKSELFETKTIIGTNPSPTEVFDILILFQLPQKIGENLDISSLLSRNKPVLWVLGANSDFESWNKLQPILSISTSGFKLDKAMASRNMSFQKFALDPNTESILNKLPPLLMPFGEYSLLKGSENVLTQKINGVQTERTLLAVNENAKVKMAVIAGEGIWQWRQEEFFMNESHKSVDEIISKTIQLISVKEDKRKLRVYPTKDVYSRDEVVKIVVEAYNDLFEPIYDQNIKLKLKGDKGYVKEFNIQNSKDFQTLDISKIPAGVYSFDATSTILGKSESAAGEFVVTADSQELLNTTANFDDLKTMAAESKGRFVAANQLSSLQDYLIKNKPNGTIYTKDDLRDIINFKWILVLLIGLATIEWATRKYLGQY